jgi:NADPH:quinone reductase-like Zn-dependent oxidoreductase
MTMRALVISAHGGPEQLHVRDDVPVPALRSETDVRVRVHAAALNHLDLFMLGGLPHIRITPPWVMGSDGAGVVEQVGAKVTRVKAGDRVMINPGIGCGACEYCDAGEQPLCVRFGVLGEHHPGTIAEYVVVPQNNLALIPDDVSWTVAAAYSLTTLTAWRMLVSRAQVQSSDRVLIWGIGGGVAQQSLQICKAQGAHVTVTSGSTAKLELARKLGADEYINHREVDVAKAIRAATGKKGVDVVVDTVGEATWAASLGSLGRKGRLVTCGGTSGPMVTTDVRKLFWNQWTIMGSTMGSDSEYSAIADQFRLGQLRPIVDSVYPLEEGRGAFECLGAGTQFGKVVISMD